MSATGAAGEGGGAAAEWLRRLGVNARATVGTLTRPPRRPVPWPSVAQVALIFAAAALAVIAVMSEFDAWSLANVRRLPIPLVEALNRFTDLGKGGFFLWPLGLALLALAMLDTPRMQPMARLVLAAWAVRLGFVFTAIAVPSLFTTIIKRLIGRARPFVGGSDTYLYAPLGWQVEYASFPSGHTTTAFAALVAIGSIVPQARALMWIYAVLIAVSRVALTSHHPSDVVAGAVVGAGGAWLVRQWFAARGLGFAVDWSDKVRPMPGPTLSRIVKALARRFSAA